MRIDLDTRRAGGYRQGLMGRPYADTPLVVKGKVGPAARSASSATSATALPWECEQRCDLARPRWMVAPVALRPASGTMVAPVPVRVASSHRERVISSGWASSES